MSSPSTIERLSRAALLLISMVLLGSSVYKALTTSFTHDESLTYNHYVTAPLGDILTLKEASPNSHLLNTLLMKAFSAIFGPSPLVLRFPNLLAHLGFLVFTFLLLRRSHPLLLLPLFILVNANPYLLDFFALARGNGLSLSFLAGSLFFFLEFARNCRIRAFTWSSLLATLAVLSHTTLVYYFLPLSALSLLLPVVQPVLRPSGAHQTRYPWKGVILVNALSLLALAALLWVPVHKLVATGQLFYGGETGFWKDTVGTLIETFLYGARAGAGSWVLKGIIVMVMVMAPVVLFLRKKDVSGTTGHDRDLLLLYLLLLSASVIVTAQFYLLGIKLPIRRYGLMFAPLFMLTLGYLLNFLAEDRNGKLVIIFATWILAGLFTAHTIRSFSSSTFLDWTYEKNTARMMEVLERDHRGNPSGQPVTMGITWLYEPTINYYRQTRPLSWLQPVTR
ncbi:MAG TPA: hypothetical protein PLK82_08970, partial [Bacteroidales bacterium]|nr:hypothetical protein [Bacteroidales bacterium]